MKRSRRVAWSFPALLVASLAVIPTASAEQFLPALQAQNPPAVNGSTTTATPNIAIVVGHTGSMMEDISTGRVGFVSADFNDSPPAAGCSGATCACTGGASGSSYAASPTLFNPAHFRLFCGDGSIAEPSAGEGPLLTDIKNVNVFDNISGTAYEQYQGFMARLYPDIDFVASGCVTSVCAEGTGQQFVGTTYTEATDYTGPDYNGSSGTADVCARAGTTCELLTPPGSGDGVADRAVYPWDSDSTYTLNARFNYQPTSGGGAPYKKIDADFPYLDPITGFNFNYPVRMQDPGTTSTLWRNSKLRASMCAVEGFLGLNRFRTLADGSVLNCALDDLGDSTADDANADGYDDFYQTNVKGKASVALFKTYQLSPGLYPPFDEDSDYTENRLRVDLRVADFYGPGSTSTLGTSFGCDANGDEPCNRSVALLEPDVNRNFADSNRWHECMGLGRNNSSGTPFQTSIGDDNATIRAAIDSRYGVPGGVMSLSGILRDACGTNGSCPGASSTLPNSVASSGIFSADTNACGSSNALVIITDSPDSCADISCSTSVGERLPGYPDSPVQPFPANATASATCPDNIAAAMRASSSEAKTYVIGLDADWDTAVKRSVAAVAAAGGTNSYYPARSFDDVEKALRGIFEDAKFSGEAVIPAGVFALGIAPASSTDVKDVVIDARYRPQTWQGYLFAREINQSGQPLPFWEAGSLLAARDLSQSTQARNTFTTLDLNCDGRIGGADELAVFGTSNPDLTTAGGPYATRSACTGTPRTSLKNVHDTGAPFFLDSQVNPAQGWTNRDGNAYALIDYTIGLTPAQITADVSAVSPAVNYRQRNFDGHTVWPLYDSVNSSPVIVGPSLSIQANDASFDLNSGLTDFEHYQATVIDRPRVAYIGTNGGSLHAFNVDGNSGIVVNGAPVAATAGAAAGGELFAIWPHEMLNRLKRYANVKYGVVPSGGSHPVHEDGLDLTARIFDAKIYSNTEGAPLYGWRTVLVIGDRNGGHGYLALDVTDPEERWSLQDKDSTGALVPYHFPTLLWEFDEFRDDGHTITGDPSRADAQCDEDLDASPGTADPTERSRFADCEDNGQDDNWQDRLGRSWSTPFVTRARTTDGNPVMYVLSGPGTIEPGGSPPGTSSSGAGFVLAIDVSTGSLIDLDSGSANGLPLKVSDNAITDVTTPNAGPVCIGGTGVACTGGQFIAPFRTSIAGADITGSDDATYFGQRADVLYWGDLAGRLWRGRFTSPTSNDLQPNVLFFPGVDANAVDTAHPIVSRPTMTPSKRQTLLGSSPPLLVVWGDGSLAFGPTDVAEGIYPVDEVGSDERFRILAVVDDAQGGTTRYVDKDDETAQCATGTGATLSNGSDQPNSNGSGNLENRTVAGTYTAITDPQAPPDGTLGGNPDPVGGYYQCLANNVGGALAGATGSERILGSPAILGGAVIVETMRPVNPISNVCYNVGTGSILAFDYSTAGIVNFTLKGGVTGGGGGKYYTAPENPVAVANTPGYKAIGPTPDGFPPDFLRYHVVTGAEAPAPQVPVETIYWREPF